MAEEKKVKTTKTTAAKADKPATKSAPKKVAAKPASETKKPAVKKATTKTTSASKNDTSTSKVKITKTSKTAKAKEENVVLATKTESGALNVSTKTNETKKAIQEPLKATAKSKLNSTIWSVEKKYDQAIFDTIMSERASRRQGTHHTKTREEVSGTGKKPFRQKGTGNARQGTLRAPQMVGGGIAWGPRNTRNYKLKVNKSTRRHALNAALAYASEREAVVIENLKMATISTKSLITKLKEFNADKLRRVLIVSDDENLFLSARNLRNVKITKVTSLLVEDLIALDALFISEDDIKVLESLVG
ncbi:50S ribosomal protein L4 [Mycoplasmopsis agassizii]|uniref:Large ribosomal subunit protein uL4 n=2 Tax=Mycoplasmopsis agassizii TaxID=33922 RepID=A0A269TJX4_9BACT|nr:50S ribosomal protein L4 [Mycoplasmopsis agassizii]PAK21657.1 50S ribosomal protein L4 [Mycoplasmopsis agassizii]